MGTSPSPPGSFRCWWDEAGAARVRFLKMLAEKSHRIPAKFCSPMAGNAALLSPEPYVITWTNVRQNVGGMSSGVEKRPEERYEHARWNTSGLLGWRTVPTFHRWSYRPA